MVIKLHNFMRSSKLLTASAITTISSIIYLPGQEINYNYFYRVYFKDKGEINVEEYSPYSILSEKAVTRRQKTGIPLLDISDIPVNTDYISQIVSYGYKLHCTSKWMNSALFKTDSSADLYSILDLPFVKEVLPVKYPSRKSYFKDKLEFLTEDGDLPLYDRPITMVEGYSLHNTGYEGQGIIIAVLDGGFLNTYHINSLYKLHYRKGIKATYDFVNMDEYVYSHHNHGTAVLSVLAGRIPGVITGTAPGADYLLIRTEDVSSEYPVEEDFWVAGAEFADSAGADIISSSLGYYYFDDPLLNYKFSQFDGNSIFITQAADAAASKGILVITSAGNERNKEWKHIIAPSDGDSVIAVGAVDADNIISAFSSPGPSADGRIKPDNVAMGVQIPVQVDADTVRRANGTSFSCPVISGMCACLMQAVPEATNTDIINYLRRSSDRFLTTPDSLYGYGLPDFRNAFISLQESLLSKPENELILGPNPFTDDINITFKQAPGKLRLEIYTATGRLVSKRNFNNYTGRSLRITDLQYAEQGIYIIRLTIDDRVLTHKVIKINR
jgi:serine protease AprX